MSGNPILQGRGVCDPHIRIFGDTAYLYATHDKGKENSWYTMNDWWIWSSKDLVNWKFESSLDPGDTYLGPDFNQCWATDAVQKNGKYYWYLSVSWTATAVVVSDSPTGPWSDPLGKPLIKQADVDGECAHDPSILIEADGTAYIAVGAWNYYIAKLNDDMISLAEKPRKIIINNPQGVLPNKTDDKPTLHKRNGIYYLSWGAYYAMSDNIYGPYDCKGPFIVEEKLDPEFKYSDLKIKGFSDGKTTGLFRSIYDHLHKKKRLITWDRHGSFFEWRGQWYFICNDVSHSRNTFFRDSVIAYVHYRDNGEIEPIRITKAGVSLAEKED